MIFQHSQTTEKTFILLSLGANIGDKIKNLKTAINYLKSSESIFELNISSFFKTEPYGHKSQEWFVNIAATAMTNFSLRELFDFCKSIEKSIGRVKREKWHPREIDIDILLFGDKVYKDNFITIPHPGMNLRKFVLIPANEIASDAVHPILKLTVSKLLEQCIDDSVVMNIIE